MTNSQLVDAKFDVYGMVGNPVSQTQTPKLFNQYCQANNHSAVMVPFNVAEKLDLENLIQMMKNSQFLSGFVSTIPFKADLYSLCNEHGAAATILGKVNTVKISSSGNVVGEMFDGIGFIQALKSKTFSFTDKNCLVIGCGSAGQAIAAELNPQGISKCTVIDTNSSALNRFREIISTERDIYHLTSEIPDDFSQFDLIINASPLGMRSTDVLPCNLKTVKENCYVGDCVTNFETTAFLEIANNKGCPIVSGADMANGQLMSILKFFNIIE